MMKLPKWMKMLSKTGKSDGVSASPRSTSIRVEAKTPAQALREFLQGSGLWRGSILLVGNHSIVVDTIVDVIEENERPRSIETAELWARNGCAILWRVPFLPFVDREVTFTNDSPVTLTISAIEYAAPGKPPRPVLLRGEMLPLRLPPNGDFTVVMSE